MSSNPIDFSSIPDHQEHTPTIGPPRSTVQQTEDEVARLGHAAVNEKFPYVHPLDALSTLGDEAAEETQRYAPQAVTELALGGKAAGKPQGTESGLVNNPVTQTLSMAEDVPAMGAKAEELAGKVGSHLAETGKQFYQGLKDEGRAAAMAKAPVGSAEAGKVPLGGKKHDFTAIPGHIEHEPAPEEKVDTSFNFGANEKPGNPQVAESAQRYNASRGQGTITHEPVPLPEEGEKHALADAYDAAKHEPNNPKVQKSYQAFKDETKAQFNHAQNDLGIKFDFTDKDPYHSAEEMQNDIRNNHHLSTFTGGDVPKDHPLAEIDPETGQSYNHLFRATHDVFGHAAGGNDFTEAGEHSAYGAHKQMYSPEAQPAVRTETQGQSNWYFNNRDVRNGKTPDTFPEQKATILPENGKAEDTTIPKGTREEYKSAADKTGVEFRGVQEGVPGAHPGLAIFQDPKSGTSVAVRLNEWSPEKLQEHIDTARKRMEGTPPVSAVSANAETPPAGETPTTGYHPDLQKIADKYGVSEHPVGVRRGSSFLAPDGKFIHLEGTTHDSAIDQLTDRKVGKGNRGGDNRPDFLDDTGTIRLRFRPDAKTGETLSVSVPKQGVTPEQAQGLKDAVAHAMPRGTGNLVIERSDISPETKDTLSKTQEMVKPYQIDQLLKDIHAHHEGDWARTASDEMMKSPAGAIDPKTGSMDHEGFGVEVFPEARAAREALKNKPTEQDIRDFHAEHQKLFDKNPELRVGWDKTDKGWELNVGAAAKNEAGAKLLGRRLGQRAAWDIAGQKEIPTGGTGEKTNFRGYKLEDRLADLTGKNVEKLPKGVRDSEHLTDDEKYLLGSNKTTLKDFQDVSKRIASHQELAATAKAGEANRFWYDRAKKTFDAVFDSLPKDSFPPEDRNRFIRLVAATSPRSDVVENVDRALQAYQAWAEGGRPVDPVKIRSIVDPTLLMPGVHGPNAARAVTDQELSGPKVSAFTQNFMGSAKHVTNDMWGAITNGIVDPQEITSPGAYIALSENYRKAAEVLGWTPQQTQAASWGFIRTLGNMSGLGGKLAGKDRPAAEVLKMMDDPMVQKYSGDVAEIFLTSPKVRERLEGLGINLEDFDGKLEKSIEQFGRSRTDGTVDSKHLARSAKRVENAKAFVREQAAKGKSVNDKAAPLFQGPTLKTILKREANAPVGFINPDGDFVGFKKGETSHDQVTDRIVGKKSTGNYKDDLLDKGWIRKAGIGSYEATELAPKTVAAIEKDILGDVPSLKKQKGGLRDIIISVDGDETEIPVDDFVEKYNGDLNKAMTRVKKPLPREK